MLATGAQKFTANYVKTGFMHKYCSKGPNTPLRISAWRSFQHFLFLCRPTWVALIRVRTCLELRAFDTPHLNWYMSAFLLHSSAASARLRVLSVYGGAIVTSFSIVTMTLYRWSSQSIRIIVIVVTITHAHSLPPFTSSVMEHRWHRNSWMIYIYTKLLIITALISPLSENAPIILMLRR